MTRNAIGIATVLFAFFTLVAWLTAATDIAVAEPASANMAPFVTIGDGGGSGYAYVGTNKCKMCHSKQYKSWKKTKMASAINILKPGVVAEVKTKHGLDPNKDYTTDAACLKCHTTGFGAQGGYAIPDPNDKKAIRKARKLASVGCEACHGPGSAYIKVFKDIFRSKRKYKVEELHAAGLRKMNVSVCTSCHNDQGPTYTGEFDFAKRKKEGTHKHIPLKQREE